MTPAEELLNKLKNVGITDEDLKIIREADEEIPFLDESFEMDHSYEPSDELTIIELNGVPVLTSGNMMSIVSPPGTGKSNICEAFCANGVNPECDAFGFKISLRKDKAILLIDTERTKNDMHRGYRRIHNRARTWENPEQLQGYVYKRCHFRSYKVLDDINQCIEHLEYHIKTGLYGLIIIDQVADFLKSVNQEDGSKLFVRQLEIWATKYDIGILCTIHPNPKDLTYKPTGHLGSALMKKCETVMACFKTEADRNVRLITTNFDHGKVRNGYDILETAFEWNDELKMHVTSDSDTVKQAVDITANRSTFMDSSVYQAFDMQIKYKPEDLVKRLRIILGDVGVKKDKLDKITVEFLTNYASERGIIELTDGYYFLVNDKTDGEENKAPF